MTVFHSFVYDRMTHARIGICRPAEISNIGCYIFFNSWAKDFMIVLLALREKT